MLFPYLHKKFPSIHVKLNRFLTSSLLFWSSMSTGNDTVGTNLPLTPFSFKLFPFILGSALSSIDHFGLKQTS